MRELRKRFETADFLLISSIRAYLIWIVLWTCDQADEDLDTSSCQDSEHSSSPSSQQTRQSEFTQYILRLSSLVITSLDYCSWSRECQLEKVLSFRENCPRNSSGGKWRNFLIPGCYQNAMVLYTHLGTSSHRSLTIWDYSGPHS
ncbi:hypothetical protein RRG08_027032 [Elysia crispata]|uniref:Uncharacterized protein n=1 Tax=Elysia crispata TaxID=231223 RepID=A0AAE0ZHK2_9GAST|nr:hypothetical protein RRG08_027032 [Elysia crispata]